MIPGPQLPAAGGCRCGRVRFEIAAPPIVTMACHCRGCQRMSASAYSLSAAIPKDGFRVTQGAPVPGGAGGEDAPRHRFCPDCKSWMFTDLPGVDFFVNVRATLLDDPSWFAPFIETFVAERLPWARTPAVHRYDGFPPEADWPRLMAEFAEWRP